MSAASTATSTSRGPTACRSSKASRPSQCFRLRARSCTRPGPANWPMPAAWATRASTTSSPRSRRRPVDPRSRGPSAALGLVAPAPVLERILVVLQVQFGHAHLEPFLHVEHGLVVDHRPDLLDEEIQQRAGRDVADRLVHGVAEVALDGADRFGAQVFRQVDHACILALASSTHTGAWSLGLSRSRWSVSTP